jgi:hypothetical protein
LVKANGSSEAHSEMARRGFHYDRTAVAHALIDLVKDGILTRQGKPRRYQYTKKTTITPLISKIFSPDLNNSNARCMPEIRLRLDRKLILLQFLAKDSSDS